MIFKSQSIHVIFQCARGHGQVRSCYCHEACACNPPVFGPPRSVTCAVASLPLALARATTTSLQAFPSPKPSSRLRPRASSVDMPKPRHGTHKLDRADVCASRRMETKQRRQSRHMHEEIASCTSHQGFTSHASCYLMYVTSPEPSHPLRLPHLQTNPLDCIRLNGEFRHMRAQSLLFGKKNNITGCLTNTMPRFKAASFVEAYY